MKLVEKKGIVYIYDLVRNKYIKLTPEELVRQKFINYLIKEKGYFREMMIVEYFFNINDIRKRADLIVFDKECKPFILVEFKENNKKIDDKVLDQIMVYNTKIKAKILVVTNGKDIFIFEKKEEKYIELDQIPNK